MNNSMTLWQPDKYELLPPNATTPKAIAKHAAQLSERDKKQIVSAFKAEHYEMGLNFLWLKTITSLKRELATVGPGLLGEMLGKVGARDDDVEDLLTPRETIRLAEELGVVTRTEALRLRHTHEIVTHFNQLALGEEEEEQIDGMEAIVSLKTCVKAVLAKPRIEVARTFVEFREALESESFVSDGDKLHMLMSSPYFFWKLTIGILMNAAKDATGSKLEHCLTNLNILLPEMWSNLRETEKWHVGRTYAEVYSEGRTTSAIGLKKALMKVQGFDFVPENLRSDTFIKAAEAILRAHDGMNNFYTEGSPTKNLYQLGTSIPTPALAACITALLAVYLGNQYGYSWAAAPTSEKILSLLSGDRWQYYLNQVLPTDTRILNKLSYPEPRCRWLGIVTKYNLSELDLKEREISGLVRASQEKQEGNVEKWVNRLLAKFYGKG